MLFSARGELIYVLSYNHFFSFPVSPICKWYIHSSQKKVQGSRDLNAEDARTLHGPLTKPREIHF